MTKSATNKKWISNRAYDIGWTRTFGLHHHLPEEMTHQDTDRKGDDGIPPSQGPDPDGDSAVVAPLEQGEDIVNDQRRYR